jgi:hypothetical protein
MEETTYCHKYGHRTSLNLRTDLKHLFAIQNTNLSHYYILRIKQTCLRAKAWRRMWKRGTALRIPVLGYVWVTSRLWWNGLFVHGSTAGWPAKAVWRREEQNVFTPDEKRRPISLPHSPQLKYQTDYAFSLGSIFQAPNFYFNPTVLEKQYLTQEHKTRHVTLSVNTSKKKIILWPGNRYLLLTFSSGCSILLRTLPFWNFELKVC